MSRLLPFALLLFLSVLNRAESASPELKSSVATPIQYYLSLPNHWNAASSCPIVVTIEGSGHDFLGNFQSFVQARGDRPFIIVTPCVSSNGHDPADAAGILSIAEEVCKTYHAPPKFFLTGFSTGGHTAWQIIFAHPERLAGAAPACANYLGRGVDQISSAPERVQLPIHAFQGEKDGGFAAFTAQWEHAKTQATQAGYQNLARTIVPNAAHTSLPPDVLNFFTSLLPSSEQKAAAQ